MNKDFRRPSWAPYADRWSIYRLLVVTYRQEKGVLTHVARRLGTTRNAVCSYMWRQGISRTELEKDNAETPLSRL